MLASDTDGRWGRGYVSGSFDMFHIGHLNLIRRAKERCDHLVVGVLADECIAKGKKKWPVIPLRERMEIVGALKYVDELDVTTEPLLNKVAAWEKYRFDAMFSGDDHLHDGWAWEEEDLKARGAVLVFFPYTKEVSTTLLRELTLPPKASAVESLPALAGHSPGADRLKRIGAVRKVITYGTWDLFHEGHRRLLERAKALGDYLIVGVTTEQYDLQRGKMNVVDPLMRRIDNVRGCGFADEVIIEEHAGQKISDVQKYEVDVFTVGSDWLGKFDHLKEYCQVVYLDRTKSISSTNLREERYGIVPLGVVGTGRIAKRTMEEVKLVSGVSVEAIYNPHIESARYFADIHEVEAYFDDYDAFLDRVGAVYIASPHGTHYGYARRALLAGRHVLCEKPMVLRESEARELFDLARSRGLVLMEAIKTAYLPGFQNLLAIVRGGRLGKIRDVEAAFTKLVPDMPGAREYDPGVGGSFTELASYSLLPIIKILGAEYRDLRFEFFTEKNGVDIYAKAHFKYDEAVACAKTGIGVKSEGQLLISGSEGYILAKSPWWLTKSFEICRENTEENETVSVPFAGFGLRYEIADFVRNISDPHGRNYALTRKESIAMAGVMESFLEKRKM